MQNTRYHLHLHMLLVVREGFLEEGRVGCWALIELAEFGVSRKEVPGRVSEAEGTVRYFLNRGEMGTVEE